MLQPGTPPRILLAMNDQSDWLAWGMHFVLGGVVGAGFGSIFIRGGRRSIPLIERDHGLLFVLGMALLVAAMASRYGDALWVGDNYRVIPPDEPRHSSATLRASIAAGGVGVLLMCLALARTYGLLP
jgi:hypothetical protein